MTGAEATGSARRPEFAEVYRVHWSWVHRFVTGLVRRGDVALAEDLTQVTFVRAWRSLPEAGLAGPGAVRAWLCTIARRVVADHYRKGPGRQWALEVAADPTTASVWRGHRIATPDDTDRVCTLVDLARSMTAAGPEHHRAVQLRVGAELPWAEVAAAMRRGKAAVRRMVAEVTAP